MADLNPTLSVTVSNVDGINSNQKAEISRTDFFLNDLTMLSMRDTLEIHRHK